MPSRKKTFAKLLLVVGLVLLIITLAPLVYSSLKLSILTPKLIDPTAVSQYKLPQTESILGYSATDYSQAETWFESPTLNASSSSGNVKYYLLSIPVLGMHDIPIEIDGHDLKKNAIHYPGTALPGLVGNTVIFGHSSLPYFFKPLNPLTIFNPLVDAQKGQVITIKYDGVDYSYSITDKFQVTPKQVEVLSQNTSNREITLITCVPLGTYWHRLIIKGQMIKSL